MRGNQLYRLGYCLPSVAESDGPAPSFAVVLNFASLSDFFARMASRRAAARAFASDMTPGRSLKRGDAPVGAVSRLGVGWQWWKPNSLDKRANQLETQSHVEVILKTWTNDRCIWYYHRSLYASFHLVLLLGRYILLVSGSVDR